MEGYGELDPLHPLQLLHPLRRLQALLGFDHLQPLGGSTRSDHWPYS